MTYFPPFPGFNQGPGGELLTMEKSLQLYHSPHCGPTGTSVRRDVETEVGGGTVATMGTESEWRLATTAAASDAATQQSAVNCRPIPGTLAEVGFSIRIATAMTGNQVAEWGLDDEDTGVGFGQDSSGLFVYVRRNATQTKVSQSSWNVDALGGLGPSGLSLTTPTTATRFIVEFSSTFLGLINFYVVLWNASTYELQKVLVHRWAPVSGAVDSAPFAPLRFHLENGATATAAEVYCQERWFATSGKTPNPVFREVFQFRLNIAATTSVKPTISCRRKTGAENARSVIYVTSFDVVTDADLIVKLALDHTLTGASFATGQTAANETSTEMDISATAIAAGSNMFEALIPSPGGTINLDGIDRITLPFDQTPVTLTTRTISGTGTSHFVLRLAEEF